MWHFLACFHQCSILFQNNAIILSSHANTVKTFSINMIACNYSACEGIGGSGGEANTPHPPPFNPSTLGFHNLNDDINTDKMITTK
jgi:hypothetical protein